MQTQNNYIGLVQIPAGAIVPPGTANGATATAASQVDYSGAGALAPSATVEQALRRAEAALSQAAAPTLTQLAASLNTAPAATTPAAVLSVAAFIAGGSMVKATPAQMYQAGTSGLSVIAATETVTTIVVFDSTGTVVKATPLGALKAAQAALAVFATPGTVGLVTAASTTGVPMAVSPLNLLNEGLRTVPGVTATTLATKVVAQLANTTAVTIGLAGLVTATGAAGSTAAVRIDPSLNVPIAAVTSPKTGRFVCRFSLIATISSLVGEIAVGNKKVYIQGFLRVNGVFYANVGGSTFSVEVATVLAGGQLGIVLYTGTVSAMDLSVNDSIELCINEVQVGTVAMTGGIRCVPSVAPQLTLIEMPTYHLSA